MARAVQAVRRAALLRPRSVEVAVRVARFWSRQGLIAEAEAALRKSVAATLPAGDEPGDQRVEEMLKLLETQRGKLRGEAGGLGQAQLQLAVATWGEAREPLETLLGQARRQADAARADRTARLLLARDPDSVAALRHLAERTRSPALIVPHLHYVARLARIDRAQPHWRAELERLQRALVGESPNDE